MSDPYLENHHEKLLSHNLLSMFMLYLILGISFMFIFIVKDDKDPVRHRALKVTIRHLLSVLFPKEARHENKLWPNSRPLASSPWST